MAAMLRRGYAWCVSSGEAFALLVLLACQLLFWNGVQWDGKEAWKGTKAILPKMDVVPPVPTWALVEALSFGDKQFYFRYAAFVIQNAGDTFGRVTPLKDYDYGALSGWWSILDRLDSASNYVPSLVAYYYSGSQDHAGHMPYVIRYLEEHADRDPARNWWWYHQAGYIARYKLQDQDWALRLAYKLADLPKDAAIPIWARQMPAFLLEKRGEYRQACEIILNILDTHENLSPQEINFIHHFINDRIAAMAKQDEQGGDPLDPRCLQLVKAQEKVQSEQAP